MDQQHYHRHSVCPNRTQSNACRLMKKIIIHTLLGILLTIAVMGTIAYYLPVPVNGQSGTGPFGKRVTDMSNNILVLPNLQASPGTAGVPNNAITVNGGNIYVYQSSSGLWYKATLSSPTATPTPTATATSTATATATASATVSP